MLKLRKWRPEDSEENAILIAKKQNFLKYIWNELRGRYPVEKYTYPIVRKDRC